MAGKTKNYTEEFKKQIVNLAKSGMSARSIAQDYGISKSSVTKWMRDFNNRFKRYAYGVYKAW